MIISGQSVKALIRDDSRLPYTYLVSLKGHPLYKVGTTQRIQGRIRSLQTDSPFEIKCLALHAGGDEKWFHENAPKPIRGEWFRFPSNATALKWFRETGLGIDSWRARSYGRALS